MTTPSLVHGGADRSALEHGLQALYERLLSDEDLEATLEHVAALATAALPTCAFADVTLLRDGRPVTKGATDPRAMALDAVQYETAAGPCLDAWQHHRPVHVDSTRTDRRWPKFAAAAFEAGVHSVLALPLAVRGTVIGALNLYSLREHAWSEDDVEIGALFARQAAIALENARTHQAAVDLARQLAEALESRATIEQAKGVVMAQERCSPDEAFERLVTRSQQENRKLRQVAQEVVDEAGRRS